MIIKLSIYLVVGLIFLLILGIQLNKSKGITDKDIITMDVKISFSEFIILLLCIVFWPIVAPILIHQINKNNVTN